MTTYGLSMTFDNQTIGLLLFYLVGALFAVAFSSLKNSYECDVYLDVHLPMIEEREDEAPEYV